MPQGVIDLTNIVQRNPLAVAVANLAFDGQRLVVELQRLLFLPQIFVDCAKIAQDNCLAVAVAHFSCNG